MRLERQRERIQIRIFETGSTPFLFFFFTVTHTHTLLFHRFSPPIHETLIFLVPLPGSEDLGLDWAEVADAAASPLRKKMEGGKRITVSPRPCCGRRIVAAKKRPRANDGFVNSVKKLQRREISSKRDRAFTMSDAQERFRNIRLQVPFS